MHVDVLVYGNLISDSSLSFPTSISLLKNCLFVLRCIPLLCPALFCIIGNYVSQPPAFFDFWGEARGRQWQKPGQ